MVASKTDFLMKAARFGMPAVSKAVERKRIDCTFCGGSAFGSKTDARWFSSVFLALPDVIASTVTLLRKTVRFAFSNSETAGSTASDS